MKLQKLCVSGKTKQYIRASAIAGMCILMTLCSVPIKVGATGEVQAKETYYKETLNHRVVTYEWSELLLEKQRFQLPKIYCNAEGEQIYTGFKAFENSYMITKYEAGRLNKIANTDKTGIKTLNGRYLVAIGSHFHTNVGQYFDIVLENGTTIPCIMGDLKADTDTDEANIFSLGSGCATEFIVDKNALPSRVLQSGNVSKMYEIWDSPVKEIIVYENTYQDTEMS